MYGRGVDRAQAAVDRERLDRAGRAEALRGDDLEGVAGVDVLDDPRDVGLELLAGHVRLHATVSRRSLAARPHPGRGSRDLAAAAARRVPSISSAARS